MPSSRRWFPAVTVLLPLAWFLAVGDRGIAFGRHWDEPLVLGDLRQSLRTRTLLPTGTDNYGRPGLAGGHYEYPSVLYWVGMATAVPPCWTSGPQAAVVDVELFAIRLRQACLAVTSLAVVGTFALGWLVSRRWTVGLAAACLLATSWECNYHSRFVAPDGLLMAATAACLALAVASVRRPRLAWWAAAAAGAATGVKYPGGLLVVPVLTAAILARPRRWARLPLLLAVQAAAFVLTTPGAVLQPWHFAAWVRFNRDHYGTVGHFGHTILNHWAHATAMVEYLSWSLPSPWRPVAVAVSAAAALGIACLCRRNWRVAAVVLPFPVLYVGYFSQQIVMIVRNLLLLAPPLAVLAAVGWAAGRSRRRWVEPARWGALLVVLAADGGWQWWAAGHMADRRTAAAQVAAAALYLSAHRSLRVYPSEPVAAALNLPLVPATGDGPAVVLAFAQEDGDLWRWPANVPGLTRATFGAFACNFDCYPNWMDDRLVLLDVAQARRVPVAQVERAVRRHDVPPTAPMAGRLLAYLDCGGTPTVTAGGVTIRSLDGVAVGCQGDVAVTQPDALTIQADNHRVTFEIAGLDPRTAYQVGWSWWDWNRARRRTSVWASWDGATITDAATPDPARTVPLLGPTIVPPWPLVSAPMPHELDWRWPPRPLYWRPIAPPRWAALPPAACRAGTCRITFRREAGPDVVVSGLWVWRAVR